jgi:aquaporin Z
MSPLHIKVLTGTKGWIQLKASWQKNWKLYFQEALGLAIFMASACFFAALLESSTSGLHTLLPDAFTRNIIMALLMGATALLIFYSPLTATSGAHINPAASITFFRLGKLCHWDVVFYILFQIAGGTTAVYLMQWLIGAMLIEAPVQSAATVPGKPGIVPAFVIELAIAFITMSVILFCNTQQRLKKYTRFIAALLVCCWVIFAGPVSGFGINPARSLASAIPSGVWTAWWIYMIAPFAGMLAAAEVHLLFYRRNIRSHRPSITTFI